MNFSEVKELFNKSKIDITEKEYLEFVKYEELLLEWNEKINLTAITQDSDIWVKHFLDSAIIKGYINEGARLIDIGTGAGFPGIPLKILRSDIKLTLLDSLNKRINFLKEVCTSLDKKEVLFTHGRAEDLAKDKNYREKYDVVTARAVSNLSTLLELCIPFLKVNGIFICMKSSNIDEELKNAENALKQLNADIIKIDNIKIPDTDIERKILIIRKNAVTSSKYPRKAGTPAKLPL